MGNARFCRNILYFTCFFASLSGGPNGGPQIRLLKCAKQPSRNAPVVLSVLPVLGALAAGNGCVIKPPKVAGQVTLTQYSPNIHYYVK
eukprot:934578-Amphidinium_carterae.1